MNEIRGHREISEVKKSKKFELNEKEKRKIARALDLAKLQRDIEIQEALGRSQLNNITWAERMKKDAEEAAEAKMSHRSVISGESENVGIVDEPEKGDKGDAPESPSAAKVREIKEFFARSTKNNKNNGDDNNTQKGVLTNSDDINKIKDALARREELKAQRDAELRKLH